MHSSRHCSHSFQSSGIPQQSLSPFGQSVPMPLIRHVKACEPIDKRNRLILAVHKLPCSNPHQPVYSPALYQPSRTFCIIHQRCTCISTSTQPSRTFCIIHQRCTCISTQPSRTFCIIHQCCICITTQPSDLCQFNRVFTIIKIVEKKAVVQLRSYDMQACTEWVWTYRYKY